ncbi:MAG: hypothetical protein MJY99_11930 [Fibrobacter sp.]|nr:hypothetical protein [Fibrobacter sp.]
MDVEYNVIGKLLGTNLNNSLERLKSAPFQSVDRAQFVGETSNGEQLEVKFKFEDLDYLLRVPQACHGGNSDVNFKGSFCADIRLKNVIVPGTGVYAAEMLDAMRMRNVCLFLSQTFCGKASMEKCTEVYGNCNVFNGGSDYEVIEEKWMTCVCDKGVLVEEKNFTK